MSIKDKFQQFKATPKTIIAISAAAVIVIGAIIFAKVGLPAIFGQGKANAIHYDRYFELDCTDAAADALSDAVGSNLRCTGEVFAIFHLTMDEGEFTLELDRDLLDEDLENFVYENADSILKAQLTAAGQATDAASLNDYAVSIGYTDWNAAVKATADSLMKGSFERATEGEITYKGTYEIGKDGVASFSDGKSVLFTANKEADGTVIIDYSFDRQAPEFMYDYFKRGVDLEFEENSSKPNGSGHAGSDSGIAVNIILDTVATTTEATTETTTETTPPPTTTEATVVATNPDGTPQTNADGTPVFVPVETTAPLESAETAAVE